jgi:hypothetical protein
MRLASSMKCFGASLLLACSFLSGQTSDLSPATLFIAKAVTHNRAASATASAYTCLETIEREERKNNSPDFRRLDLVRVEIVKLSNKELFAWPGGG